MEPVKFGIVGVGGMGAAHVKIVSEMEEAKLVAVADVNGETARRVAEETGAKAFVDYKQLIRKGGVEAVVIATPHYFHPPVAEYAAKHGVHVLSEKPIAVTVAAADKMIEVCRANNVLLGIMFQQRTDGARVKMKQLVDSGAVGELHRVTMVSPWYRTQAYYDSGSWRGTWKGEGGGILMNQAPHSLDQFVWIGGMPQAVQAIATTRHHNIEVENSGLAIFDYGDGKVGWFYASTAEVPGGERFEVAGDRGMLVLEDGKLRHFVLEEPLSTHLKNHPTAFAAPKGEWRDVEIDAKSLGHNGVTQQFVKAVRANDESLLVANGEDGLRSLELANAMLMAGFMRREVTLPVDRGGYERMLRKLREGLPYQELRGKK